VDAVVREVEEKGLVFAFADEAQGLVGQPIGEILAFLAIGQYFPLNAQLGSWNQPVALIRKKVAAR